jgi:carbamoyltransferase
MAMLRMARHVRRETGETNLCLAGGVALNCVANGRIAREAGFENIWIQPASGDAGGALGAAFSAWHQYLGNGRRVIPGHGDRMHGALLGPSYGCDETAAALAKAGDCGHVRKLDRATLIRETARLLSEGKVVGWFQGRMEFGPRALGARSILGDPRSPAMQAKMNLKIKFRESFRPFAPSVLAEDAARYFELSGDSPYMLIVAPVAEDLRIAMSQEEAARFGIDKLNVSRSVVPAITHVDYSARVQTVRREVNALYYDLIAEFKRLTGCPMVVNTSFNVRGEPIVCTPEDAIRCFERTNMDVLVMGDFLVEKESTADVEAGAWVAEFQLD